MNIANPFKVGDLISLRVIKYEAPDYRMWTDPNYHAVMPKYETQVVARRVVKVHGDTVYFRMNKKIQGLGFRNVNRVY